jgi:hypothetical protein
MSSTKIASSSVAQSAGADTVQRVIGIAPAPLLPTEAESDYLGVAARIVAVAQPKDPIEEFLTRDVVDLTWEILRSRRLKGGLLRAAVSKGVHRILTTIGHGHEPYAPRTELVNYFHFADKWASGKADYRDAFDEMLNEAGFTMEEVMAEAFAAVIDPFERIDRLLASAEARRNNALREIDRHREALGAAMRRGVEEIQDAQFEEVETGSVGGGAVP